MATQANGHSRLRFSIFEVDLAAGELCKRGVRLPVQEKPFQILALLLERPGEVVTREELQERLWPNGTFVDFDKGLNTAVKKLRSALGDSPDKPVFIETIPRRGYRFIAPILSNGFQPGEAPASEAIASHSESAFHSSNQPIGARKYWYSLVAPLFLVALAALAVVMLAIFGVIRYVHRSSDPAVTTRFLVVPPKGGAAFLTLSPNGRMVAFTAPATNGNGYALWIRSFDSIDPKEVPGTDGAYSPFWSPDSRYLGFFTNNKLKKVELATETIQALCEAPVTGGLAFGGSWSPAGIILFVPDIFGGILRVSANGGIPVRLTTPDTGRQEVSHLWPYFLPDGEHFLYFVQSKERRLQGIYVASLSPKNIRRPHRLLDSESDAAFSPTGHLLFVRGGHLFAQSFDPDRLRLNGDPVPIVDDIQFLSFTHHGSFSLSGNGVLAFQGSISRLAQIVWRDRSGAVTGSIGPPGEYLDLELSPDGSQLALEALDYKTNSGHIWVLDLSTDTLKQLTPATSSWEYSPRWSPDGKRVIYDSNREYATGGSPGEFFTKLATGVEKEELLLQSKLWISPGDWSRNFILYSAQQGSEHSDVWMQPNDSSTPALYLQRAWSGRVSPDGRWIAYISSESGNRTDEVYVRPVQPSQGQWRISNNGGEQILWRADGKELFYLSPSQELIAVPITAGSTFGIGKPAKLFELHDLVPNMGRRYLYAVSKDGKRFLTTKCQFDSGAVPITVVLNWSAALQH